MNFKKNNQKLFQNVKKKIYFLNFRFDILKIVKKEKMSKNGIIIYGFRDRTMTHSDASLSHPI